MKTQQWNNQINGIYLHSFSSPLFQNLKHRIFSLFDENWRKQIETIYTILSQRKIESKDNTNIPFKTYKPQNAMRIIISNVCSRNNITIQNHKSAVCRLNNFNPKNICMTLAKQKLKIEHNSATNPINKTKQRVKLKLEIWVRKIVSHLA